MLTQIINGQILTPQGWLKDGSVLINDGKILEITNSDLAVIGATVIDAKGMFIVPGFVSMHCHGGGGHDFTEGTTEAFKEAVAAHLKHGSTTIFPTLSSTTFENIRLAAATCDQLMAEDADTTIMGLHIEGPYLNENMAGTQWKEFLKNPDPEEYKALVESTKCIKRWDISPELPGAHDFARYMTSKGILTAITHTEAEYQEIKDAFAAGFTHAAHFYNAMPGFHKRREYKYEGTVESVYLMDDMSVEVIADGVHLPATILKLVYKVKGVEKTCLVTDSLKFAGYTGETINDPNYVIENGVCKWADRQTLAGSIATADVLVQTMVKKAGIPLEDAVRMASETPARLTGIADSKGTLEKGKDADIVILDNDVNVRCVFTKGKEVEGTNTMIHNII
ncbi:n-acetylglucosamine-6-phosphate deacetylase [Bacteroides sp. CAG:530]|nr:n-acetylglucosamine-6-phosphate deacetylase [Bacteroides sp. CAG:530]